MLKAVLESWFWVITKDSHFTTVNRRFLAIKSWWNRRFFFILFQFFWPTHIFYDFLTLLQLLFLGTFFVLVSMYFSSYSYDSQQFPPLCNIQFLPLFLINLLTLDRKRGNILLIPMHHISFHLEKALISENSNNIKTYRKTI